jgi:hypothetical protein
MTQTIQTNGLDSQINSHHSYKIGIISTETLIKNRPLQQLITRWIKEWKTAIFEKIEGIIQQPGENTYVLNNIQIYGLEKSSRSSQIISNTQQDGILQKLKSILIFENTPISSDLPFTNRLVLYYICDPEEFNMNVADCANFFKSKDFEHIFKDVCIKFNLSSSHFAYVFFYLPSSPKALNFSEYIGISGIQSSAKDSSDYLREKWYFYNYLGDEILRNKGVSNYRSSLHYIWLNPSFEIEKFPQPIQNKIAGAKDFYNKYLKFKNPFQDKKNRDVFQEVLVLRNFYENYQGLIKKKLAKYNRKRKWIWAKSLLHKNKPSFSDVFLRCFRENYDLFLKTGFRITVYDTKSTTFEEKLTKYHTALSMNAMDCLFTGGTSYSNMIDSDGFPNPAFLHLPYLRGLLGEYAGFLEYQISPGKWIFAGFVAAIYRKKAPFSRQLYIKMLLSEKFTGSGLGRYLGLIGILLLEKEDLYDFLIEDGTFSNIKTHKLANFLGFTPYGFIPWMVYDISSSDNKTPQISGMFRKMRPNLNILEDYAHTNELGKKKEWISAVKINKGLNALRDDWILNEKLDPLFFK